jgi:hypothetical protein
MLAGGGFTRTERPEVLFENLQQLPKTESPHPPNQRAIHAFPRNLAPYAATCPRAS